MRYLRRLLVVSLSLGVLIGLTSLQIGIHTTSAQAITATVACAPGGTTCTVTINASVAPGSSITVTLPTGGTAVINCPAGCAAGSQYTVTVAGGYTAPQSGLVIGTGGLCVNGSYPGPFGCTSGFVPYTPIYTPQYVAPYFPSYFPSYIGGGCLWFYSGCGINRGCLTTQGSHHDHDNDNDHTWAGSGGTWMGSGGTWTGSGGGWRC